MDSYEFDEKVAFAYSQQPEKSREFYTQARKEIQGENLIFKFDDQQEQKQPRLEYRNQFELLDVKEVLLIKFTNF